MSPTFESVPACLRICGPDDIELVLEPYAYGYVWKFHSRGLYDIEQLRLETVSARSYCAEKCAFRNTVPCVVRWPLVKPLTAGDLTKGIAFLRFEGDHLEIGQTRRDGVLEWPPGDTGVEQRWLLTVKVLGLSKEWPIVLDVIWTRGTKNAAMTQYIEAPNGSTTVAMKIDASRNPYEPTWAVCCTDIESLPKLRERFERLAEQASEIEFELKFGARPRAVDAWLDAIHNVISTPHEWKINEVIVASEEHCAELRLRALRADKSVKADILDDLRRQFRSLEDKNPGNDLFAILRTDARSSAAESGIGANNVSASALQADILTDLQQVLERVGGNAELLQGVTPTSAHSALSGEFARIVSEIQSASTALGVDAASIAAAAATAQVAAATQGTSNAPYSAPKPLGLEVQKDMMYVITNKALMFHLPGRNGGRDQNLTIGPGGPHLVPAWIRDTPTFEPTRRDGSLKEIDMSGFTPDPAAQSPSREFPQWMYHATELPKVVASREEETQLGPGWSRVYVHQQYPKVKYHWEGKSKTVQNAAEEAALGGGWANNPGAFNPFNGPRPPRTDDQDPAKWVDEWSVPGLTVELRKKIRAQLLRADVVFDRSSDRDAGALVAMRRAFDGIVKLLLDAGILTDDLLRKEVPSFVWDCANAGGWWRLASEAPQDIFPEQIGRYWMWREDNTEALGLFRAEIRHWEAELLDAPSPTPGVPVSRDPQCQDQPARSNDSGFDFESEPGRIRAIEAYIKHWTTEFSACAEAWLARTAKVDPADLSKWKKGSLPEGSDKKRRIERALKNNEPPTPPPARKSEA